MSPNSTHKSQKNNSMEMKGEQVVQFTVAGRNPFFFFFQSSYKGTVRCE